jgi:hypothetical protein
MYVNCRARAAYRRVIIVDGRIWVGGQWVRKERGCGYAPDLRQFEARLTEL